MSKFTITTVEDLDKVISWIKDGRGIKQWFSADLSTPRPDQITPGDKGSPHWAYTTYKDLDPKDIEVAVRTWVAMVPEWHPKCERCNGTAKRSIAELASIRKESFEVTKAFVNSDSWHWGKPEGDHFPCNYCHGTGHTITPITFKVTRKFWGQCNVSQAGIRKCEAMACKLAKHYGKPISWDWEWIGGGMAQAYFYHAESKTLDKIIG